MAQYKIQPLIDLLTDIKNTHLNDGHGDPLVSIDRGTLMAYPTSRETGEQLSIEEFPPQMESLRLFEHITGMKTVVANERPDVSAFSRPG